jgi:hypothetical protein
MGGSKGEHRDVDWANTAAAQANRRAKAERLAAAAAWCGAIEVAELSGPDADGDVRAAVLAQAKVRSASEATWDVVAYALSELAPTVLAPGQTPVCRCHPHPVTGVLYESFLYAPGHGPDSDDPQPTSGWLCRHHRIQHGHAPEQLEQLKQSSASGADEAAGEWVDPMEGWDDGREPSWDDIATAAGMVVAA